MIINNKPRQILRMLNYRIINMTCNILLFHVRIVTPGVVKIYSSIWKSLHLCCVLTGRYYCSDVSRLQASMMVYRGCVLPRRHDYTLSRNNNIQRNTGNYIWFRFGCESCSKAVVLTTYSIWRFTPEFLSGFSSIALSFYNMASGNASLL